MLTATITGEIVSRIKNDETGRRYCSIRSNEAQRTVRALIRSDEHAALISQLPKWGRLSVSGYLYSQGGIGPNGQSLAYLQINVQTIKIHEDVTCD